MMLLPGDGPSPVLPEEKVHCILEAARVESDPIVLADYYAEWVQWCWSKDWSRVHVFAGCQIFGKSELARIVAVYALQRSQKHLELRDALNTVLSMRLPAVPWGWRRSWRLEVGKTKSLLLSLFLPAESFWNPNPPTIERLIALSVSKS